MSMFNLSFPKKSVLCVGLLVVLTFLAFSPVLKAQFLNWQDDKHLTANLNILTFDWLHIKILLRERINGIRVPLSSLSFSLEHHFFGLNPFIFHLTNLLLHMLVVILIFFLAQNFGLTLTEAFLGALIFALHPSKVEAVAWISERKEVLYAVFYLASLLSYQRNQFWPSFIFGLLSMLANPMALSLPFVMLLIDWFNGKRINFKSILEKWPYFFMVIGIGSTTYLIYLQMPLSHILQAPLVWVWSFAFYIYKFFIPLVSVPIYVVPKPINLFSWTYIISLLFFIAVVVGVWVARRNKWIIFAFGFYALSIFFVLPVEGIKENNVIADKFLYLPSLGFCLLSAIGVFRLQRFLLTQEAVLRYLFSTAVVILMIGLMLLTFNQSVVWHDAISLWRHQARVLPHPFVLNKLASAITDLRPLTEDHYHEAADLYQQAIKLDSQYVYSYNHLAELYKDRGRLDESLIWYNKALAVDGKNKEAMLGLGRLYQQLGQPQEAINTFKRVLKMFPDDESAYLTIENAYSRAIEQYPQEKSYQEQREEVLSQYEDLSKRKKYSATDYFNLGFLYEQVGGYEEAIRFYKKSLQLSPTYEKSLYALANRYQEMGDFKTALALYQHLVHFHPKFALGYLNMGIIYNALGDIAHARMLYQKTIGVDSKNVGAYFNLGYLSESSGDMKEALNFYEKAVDINPQFAEGYYNLGNVYATLGQIPEAIASYLKTVNINKNHQNAFVNLSILSFKSRNFADAMKYLKEAQRLGYTPPEEYLKSLEPYQKK
jgi:tetratricopeptide (TPR) repeat protein